MNFRPAPSRIKKDKVKIQKDLDISILTQALEDTQLDVSAERMANFGSAQLNSESILNLNLQNRLVWY